MQTTEIPLFPLPIVLLPGTPQLLHIFEPRYRHMLRDCLDGDKRFGLSYLTAERQTEVDRPQPGDIGCSATIQTFQHLPDGRSNILAMGETRYVVKRLVDRDTPYLMGEVEFFEDTDAEVTDLLELAAQVRGTFEEFVNVLKEINETTQMPHLPDDPAELSFHIAAALEMDAETKESLARLTSVRVRLELLQRLLQEANIQAVEQAAVHRLSKRNGKAGHAASFSDQ